MPEVDHGHEEERLENLQPWTQVSGQPLPVLLEEESGWAVAQITGFHVIRTTAMAGVIVANKPHSSHCSDFDR